MEQRILWHLKIYQGNGTVGEILICAPDCRLRVMIGRAGPEGGKQANNDDRTGGRG